MTEEITIERVLEPETKEALSLPPERRIDLVWKLQFAWIPYPRANELLRQADKLLRRPQADRMPCLLIWGDPNSGKTALYRQFCRRHPIDPNLGGSACYAPAIGIQIRNPDEGTLYGSILKAVSAPFRILDRADKKLHQVETILPKLGTRMLLFDELNTAIAGPYLTQKRFLVALKYLANELKLSIVATGTKEARRALAPDEQLLSRFKMEELPRWSSGENFRKLLQGFESRLPLCEASELQEPGFAEKLFNLSEGYIGEIAELLMQAAELAIKNRREKIDPELIDKLKWVPPSQRRREARGN